MEIFSTLLLNSTVFIDALFLNADGPISVTSLGITTFASLPWYNLSTPSSIIKSVSSFNKTNLALLM